MMSVFFHIRRLGVALIVVLLMACGLESTAQIIKHEGKAYDPHTYAAEIHLMSGDTMAVIQLHNVYCLSRKRFTSASHEKNYWRMVNDVKKTLPIAKDARRLLAESLVETENLNEKEQKEYYKKLEKKLMAQYKPRLKKLTYRQGKLLVRLIDRECDRQSYTLIRDFLGKRRAFFWNMFGKMFGISLKAKWEPDGKDKELEDICILVEQGLV